MAKAARSRQILPKHIGDESAPLRLYYVEDEGALSAGYAAFVLLREATSVSNMYVRPGYRRRGLARALMSRMPWTTARVGPIPASCSPTTSAPCCTPIWATSRSVCSRCSRRSRRSDRADEGAGLQ